MNGIQVCTATAPESLVDMLRCSGWEQQGARISLMLSRECVASFEEALPFADTDAAAVRFAIETRFDRDVVVRNNAAMRRCVQESPYVLDISLYESEEGIWARWVCQVPVFPGEDIHEVFEDRALPAFKDLLEQLQVSHVSGIDQVTIH